MLPIGMMEADHMFRSSVLPVLTLLLTLRVRQFIARRGRVMSSDNHCRLPGPAAPRTSIFKVMLNSNCDHISHAASNLT